MKLELLLNIYWWSFLWDFLWTSFGSFLTFFGELSTIIGRNLGEILDLSFAYSDHFRPFLTFYWTSFEPFLTFYGISFGDFWTFTDFYWWFLTSISDHWTISLGLSIGLSIGLAHGLSMGIPIVLWRFIITYLVH